MQEDPIRVHEEIVPAEADLVFRRPLEFLTPEDSAATYCLDGYSLALDFPVGRGERFGPGL